MTSFNIVSGKRGNSELQWRNRQGGRVPPRDYWLGNFSWPIWKKVARKKWKRVENEEEKKETCEREGGKLKMEGGNALFKTTKICFGCTKNINFLPGKRNSRPEKNLEKWLCPLRKNSCYAPGELKQSVQELVQHYALNFDTFDANLQSWKKSLEHINNLRNSAIQST